MLFCTLLSSQVTVEGVVRDNETGRPLPNAFIINHRTQNGIFANHRGSFRIECRSTDSLLISHPAYQFRKIILSDSIPRSQYVLEVSLILQPRQLRAFTVKAPKTFEQIIRELEAAENSRQKQVIDVADAVSSPITYLYMQFSREERAKQKIAELRAEDAKKELLRDLFTRYMLAHIIDPEEDEMDAFIQYSGLTNDFAKFDTEYDLVVYVKEQFARFKAGIQKEK